MFQTGSTLYIKKYRNENITSTKASSAEEICGALQINSSCIAGQSWNQLRGFHCCLGQSAGKGKTEFNSGPEDPEAIFRKV